METVLFATMDIVLLMEAVRPALSRAVKPETHQLSAISVLALIV